jgi:malonyl-CoA/methylmalonyl-CoA synthetase
VNIEQKFQNLLQNEIRNHNVVPIFKQALLYNHKTALKDINGEFSYAQIYMAAKKLSIQISNLCGSGSLSRVAFLCRNDVNYIIAQWACFMSGQIAVPLSVLHPNELLEYFLKDSQTNLLITTPSCENRMKPLAERLEKPLIVIEHGQYIDKELDKNVSVLDKQYENVLEIDDKLVIEGVHDGKFYTKSPAMIIYTSGTTNKPKGVLYTHANLNSQIAGLANAWNVGNYDTILHTLPLHHVHGVINALMLPLYVGGKVIMLPKFSSDNVWSYLLNVNMPVKDRVTLYMAVPTMYNFLIQEYDKLFSKKNQMCEYIKSHCQQKIRLMVSGSAPLPTTTFQRWKEITGHKLLERYGMTEIGMALSNPLKEDQVRQRLPGHVGQPLPGVSVRIVRHDNLNEVLYEASGELDKGFWSKQELPVYEGQSADEKQEVAGTLLVKGPNVFKEYWNKPEETKKEFIGDGWFVTGDTASFNPIKKSFKILGRNSVDIIKTGGYKISALELETKFLEHPHIQDIAIVGVPDSIWGQKIVALVQFREKTGTDDNKDAHTAKLKEDLKKWCENKFAEYSMPAKFEIVDRIPRNQMGKVNKVELINALCSKDVKE